MDDFNAAGPDPGESDRRDAGRTTLLYRPAVFEAADLTGLCLVRNVSATGLMGKVFTSLAVGTPIVIRFSPRANLAGVVVWSREGQVGLRFNEEIEVADLLAEMALRKADGQIARAPRLALHFDGEMTLNGRAQWFEAHDISQYGIKLAAPNLREGDEVLLRIEGLELRKAVVRWTRRGTVGMRFMRPLALDDLGAWAIRHQLAVQADTLLRASA